METHVFFLQVEQVVDGVVDGLREARHRHFVRLVGARLREPDVHLNVGTKNRTEGDVKESVRFNFTDQSTREPLLKRTSDLELLHQLPDGFSAGADDAGVSPRVQVNILAHHLLQLGHQLLDGLTRLLHVALVPRDGDQILRGAAEVLACEWDERATSEKEILLVKRVIVIFLSTSSTPAVRLLCRGTGC